MLQKNVLNKGQISAIHSRVDDSDYIAPENSTGAIHLNTALTIYAVTEFLAVACSAYFASTGYHYITYGYGVFQANPAYVLAAAVIATLVLVISIAFHNFFAFRRQARHIFLWRGIGSVALAFSAFLTILFFTQSAEAYSRGTLIFQIVCVASSVIITRTIFHSWLQSATASNRIEARRVVLIGDASHCFKFANRLKASGIKTIGSFRLPKNNGMKDTVLSYETTRKIISELRALQADDVIVLANNEFMPVIFYFTSCFAELPVGVHIVPVDALNVIASSQIAEFGNLQTIQVCQPPLSKFDLLVKRTFDITFAIVGLIVLSPLFLVVSIAIKLDSPGPVFFRNTRHGFNNDKICVLKFRSMTSIEDGDRFTQATENDPRVTRIGRIIRRTNIDELPQLINVLRGEMSIVGPRPHATAHNALFNNVIAPFSRRHNVKPGITGWAQVNGYRGATDALEKMQRRVEYDLYYIDNWSFLFDLKIMMMTLFSKKAYLNAY
jgi:Undecaprenyl-phosphate glucose phosphotransferase